MEIRVAKAICRVVHSYMDPDECAGYNCAGEFVIGGEGGETKPHAWMWFIESARAAIRAMYEPDATMLAAYMAALEQPACPKKEPWHNAKMRKRWRAMIDAASPATSPPQPPAA